MVLLRRDLIHTLHSVFRGLALLAAFLEDRPMKELVLSNWEVVPEALNIGHRNLISLTVLREGRLLGLLLRVCA